MLNWIKEIAVRDFATNDIDTEDFHMGFECVLPPEIQELLAGQHKASRRSNSKKACEKGTLILDEHELALS